MEIIREQRIPANRANIAFSHTYAVGGRPFGSFAALRRLGLGHCGKQRAGVRVLRTAEHGVGGTGFHDAAVLHYGYAVSHEPRHVQIVGDKEHRQPEVALELIEQVEHLRLH